MAAGLPLTMILFRLFLGGGGANEKQFGTGFKVYTEVPRGIDSVMQGPKKYLD